MVSGLLRILGINMGDNIDEKNHEDLDLQHRHPLHLRDLVAEKNEKHNIWGWKDPMLIDVIHDAIHLVPLRNPQFIVVFRDVVATTEALMREEYWQWRYAFTHVADQTDKLVNFALEYDTHNISYEKALSDPAKFVEGFCTYHSIEIDDETRQRAVKFISPGYKAI